MTLRKSWYTTRTQDSLKEIMLANTDFWIELIDGQLGIMISIDGKYDENLVQILRDDMCALKHLLSGGPCPTTTERQSHEKDLIDSAAWTG